MFLSPANTLQNLHFLSDYGSYFLTFKNSEYNSSHVEKSVNYIALNWLKMGCSKQCENYPWHGEKNLRNNLLS